MPQALMMPVEEYLRTSFRPDCDYVDGEVRARNLGERDHSTLQRELVWTFRGKRDEWEVDAFPEQRVQTSGKRFRVPDVCVLSKDAPHEQIVQSAPLLCIEILSPEDSLPRLQERLDEYAAIGVEHIWVLDPQSRRAWIAGPHGLLAASSNELSVPGTEIRVSLTDLFAELDR